MKIGVGHELVSKITTSGAMVKAALCPDIDPSCPEIYEVSRGMISKPDWLPGRGAHLSELEYLRYLRTVAAFPCI